MRIQSRDTPPDVEQMQIEGMRRFTPEQRFEMAAMLTRFTFSLSWEGLRRRYPDLHEDELRIVWCRLLYGPELAERVAAYIAHKSR